MIAFCWNSWLLNVANVVSTKHLRFIHPLCCNRKTQHDYYFYTVHSALIWRTAKSPFWTHVVIILPFSFIRRVTMSPSPVACWTDTTPQSRCQTNPKTVYAKTCDEQANTFNKTNGGASANAHKTHTTKRCPTHNDG